MSAEQETYHQGGGVVHELAPNGQDFSGWMGHAQAAKFLGISERTLRRHWENGLIARYQLPDESVRYNPAELTMFAASRGLGPTSSDEGERGEPDDKGTGERFRPAYVEMLATAVQQIRQQQEHNAKLISLITGPVNHTFEVLANTVKEMGRRASDLEAKRDEMIAAREVLLSKEHERMLLERMAERDAETRRELMGTFKTLAPRAMDHIVAGAVGQDPAKSKQVRAVVELLKTLEPATLENLVSAGVLDQKQTDLVLAILKPQGLYDEDDEQKKEPPTDEK